MEGMTIVIIAVLIIVALLLVWLSLSMAATEGSIRDGRILRVLPYHLQCARRRAGGMHRGDVRCTVVVRAAMRIRLRADRGRDFVAGASA